MNKKLRKEKKRIQLKNKKLLKKYPWLTPKNVWTDKLPRNYDYTYTWLDDMPDGWKKAFGLMMVEEIDQELRKYNYQDKYKLCQIKEKYGSLRWYDNGHVGEIGNIISKYEHISENVCLMCGKPDSPMLNGGWIYPVCFDCYKKGERRRERYYAEHDIEYVPKTNEELYEQYKNDCDMEHCIIQDHHTIRRYNGEGYEDKTYYYTETVEKIRKKNK